MPFKRDSKGRLMCLDKNGKFEGYIDSFGDNIKEELTEDEEKLLKTKKEYNPNTFRPKGYI